LPENKIQGVLSSYVQCIDFLLKKSQPTQQSISIDIDKTLPIDIVRPHPAVFYLSEIFLKVNETVYGQVDSVSVL